MEQIDKKPQAKIPKPKNRKLKLNSTIENAGPSVKSSLDQSDQPIVKPKRSFWKSFSKIFRSKGKKAEVPEMVSTPHHLAPGIHRLDTIVEEEQNEESKQIFEYLQEIQKTSSQKISIDRTKKLETLNFLTDGDSSDDEEIEEETNKKIDKVQDEESSTEKLIEIPIKEPEPKVITEEEQKTPSSLEYSEPSEQSGEELIWDDKQNENNNKADIKMDVENLITRIENADGMLKESLSLAENFERQYELGMSTMKEIKEEIQRLEENRSNNVNITTEEIVNGGEEKEDTHEIPVSSGPGEENQRHLDQTASSESLKEVELFTQDLNELTGNQTFVPPTNNNGKEVRLNQFFKIVYNSTIVYDPLYPIQDCNLESQKTTEERNKVVRKRKIMSLLHDRNDYYSKPKSTTSDTLITLENVKKELDEQGKIKCLYPENYLNRYKLISTESATNDISDEKLLTYLNIENDVENIINELLVSTTELKENCLKECVISEDEPMVSISSCSNAHIATILNEILDSVFKIIEEKVVDKSILKTNCSLIANDLHQVKRSSSNQRSTQTIPNFGAGRKPLNYVESLIFPENVPLYFDELEDEFESSPLTENSKNLNETRFSNLPKIIKKLDNETLPSVEISKENKRNLDELEKFTNLVSDKFSNISRNSDYFLTTSSKNIQFECPSTSFSKNPEENLLLKRIAPKTNLQGSHAPKDLKLQTFENTMNELIALNQQTIEMFNSTKSSLSTLLSTTTEEPSTSECQQQPETVSLNECNDKDLLLLKNNCKRSNRANVQSLENISSLTRSKISLLEQYFSTDSMLRQDSASNSLLDEYFSCLDLKEEKQAIKILNGFNFGHNPSKIFRTEVEQKVKINFGQSFKPMPIINNSTSSTPSQKESVKIIDSKIPLSLGRHGSPIQAKNKENDDLFETEDEI